MIHKRGNHYVYSISVFLDYHNYASYVLDCKEIDDNKERIYSDYFKWELIENIINNLSSPLIAILRMREIELRHKQSPITVDSEYFVYADMLFRRMK